MMGLWWKSSIKPFPQDMLHSELLPTTLVRYRMGLWWKSSIIPFLQGMSRSELLPRTLVRYRMGLWWKSSIIPFSKGMLHSELLLPATLVYPLTSKCGLVGGGNRLLVLPINDYLHTLVLPINTTCIQVPEDIMNFRGELTTFYLQRGSVSGPFLFYIFF